MGRRGAIGGAVAVVTIAHGALVAGWAPRAASSAGGRPGAVRVLIVAASPASAAVPASPPPPGRSQVPRPAPSPPAPRSRPHASPTVAARGDVPPRRHAADAGPGPQAPAPAPPAPVLPIRLPPDAERHYALWQDGRPGRASLRWQSLPSGQWRLELATQPEGRPARAWVSTGRVDPHGLAPDRLVQVERGREVRALSVERDRGVVGFSGREEERPLPPGLQDRWSWLAQLAATAEAAPGPWPPGTALSMDVAGLRGELDRWVFRVQGIDRPPATATDPSGAPRPLALHLRREPVRPWDLRVDAWLEPGSPHLPVALVLAAPPGRWSLVLHAEPVGADQGRPSDGPALAP